MEKYVAFQLGKPISHQCADPAARMKCFHPAGGRAEVPSCNLGEGSCQTGAGEGARPRARDRYKA